MTVDPLIFYIMVAVIAFMIGLAKGGLGGTLGALATPLLALVMPADQVIGLILPILMLADIFAVSFHWRRWNSKLVLLLIPGAVVGVTIGTFVIT
ncbi:MAG: TSUP family transporter, partial [Anaerolineales bacterium]